MSNYRKLYKNIFQTDFLMKNGKIYFGHPVNVYNTPKEEELVNIIEAYFPQFEVENPNKHIHSENYVKWKAEKGNGMLYFTEVVLPSMESGVFLPFEDSMFGAGVYKEAAFLHQLGKPIYEISFNGTIANMTLDEARNLSVPETRERVYKK